MNCPFGLGPAIRPLLLSIVFSATATLALPLHPGASWVYAVVLPRASTIALKSLRVLDSTPVSGGTNWRLVLRDSASGATDSLAIMAWGDGSQTWARSSPNLPWGPTRWDRSPRIWWNGWWDVSLARGTWDHPVMVQGEKVLPRPPMAWEDSAGLVWAEDPSTGTEWTLLARDGVERPARPWRLELPEVGSTWTWRTTTWSASLLMATGGIAEQELLAGLDSTSALARFGSVVSNVKTVSWEIVERQDDSAGWNRLEIRQTVQGVDSLFALRLHPATRWRKAARDLYGFDNSWWRLPGQTEVDGFTGSDLYQTASFLAGPTMGLGSWCSRGWWRTNGSGVLDSSMGSNASSSSTTHGASSTWSRWETVLLQEGTRAVRNSPLAVGKRETGPRGLALLRTLAERYPASEIRWRDLRGRGGLFPAARLESVLERRDVGLLFVEARFPDGTRWSGRVR